MSNAQEQLKLQIFVLLAVFQRIDILVLSQRLQLKKNIVDTRLHVLYKLYKRCSRFKLIEAKIAIFRFFQVKLSGNLKYLSGKP